MSKTNHQKLVLIDGNSLLYRAFFALPPLTNAKGEMTNAVYGFANMLFRILEEEQPDMIAVAFDLPGPTFRHQAYADYKATRPKTPDELAAQIGMAREVLGAMRVSVHEAQGYEADDVIGTLATQAEGAGCEVLIVTGDLDELQLVSDKVSVMVTRRGVSDTKVYDVAAVEERYGFGPDRLPDFRALRGDATDNIPGVPGIGEKTAAELVKRYGSLEETLAHAHEVTPPRVAAALQAHADLARRAWKLSVIVRDAPVRFDPDELKLKSPDQAGLAELFRRLDFRSLASRLPSGVLNAPMGVLKGEPPAEPAQTAVTWRSVSTVADAQRLARDLAKAAELVLYPIAGPGPPLRARLKGLCLSTGLGTAVLASDRVALGSLLGPLKPVLESPDLPKVGHDLKRCALLLSRDGVSLRGFAFDTMLASYVINPSRRAQELDAVAFEHLDEAAPLAAQATQLSLGDSPKLVDSARAVEQVAALRARLTDRLREVNQEPLFRDLEMPLIPVLLDMELTGIALDTEALSTLSLQLAQRAGELASSIYSLAGEEFTISSPKQLRHILFEKLGLPPDKTRRTKTGYSTDAEVLAGLSEHEIVARILEYREVTKLSSTYVDALPRLVDSGTGRLHTSFNQAVTATGRLSSSDPNLQNIPVRTQLGMEIRRAFVPGEKGWLLLSGDFSQIELRILAHITRDENLIEVFRKDEDLHRAAAVEIFGVAPEQVTSQMRSFAKMVNFGIPYGISEFRLAREMGIAVEEAHRYVQRYFARFPKLHAYVKEIPQRAREQGYVETLLGRRRYLPELKARAAPIRNAAERMAVNSPIQGSAADIMKLAMLKVHDQLAARGLSSRMILQVHDELVLEVPPGELKPAAELLSACMSGAYQLSVPLKVEVKAGQNWLVMTPVPCASG